MYNNVYPNISKAIKRCQLKKQMSINEIKDFIFKNYYKRIGFSKENSYYSMNGLKEKYLFLLANKLLEKIPDPHNAKERNHL